MRRRTFVGGVFTGLAATAYGGRPPKPKAGDIPRRTFGKTGQELTVIGQAGGKSNPCGTPQGGVVSPLLANLYMNRFLKGWRITQRGRQFRAQVVNYADDFVILSRGHAAQALEWARRVMPRLGLTLNETKTKLREARRESFDFLGYSVLQKCTDKEVNMA